jgi:hypothetical protein
MKESVGDGLEPAIFDGCGFCEKEA